MKYRIYIILVMVLFCSFFSKVSASESCSPNGYTILTINGIFTDLDGAIYNKDALKFKLREPHKKRKINIDYLYNPTHLAGVGDFVDAVAQGIFEQKSDYDLTEMLNDASENVETQKLLLVAHSQGNFYANNFYDKTASQQGGVPEESIGVYGVATPANRVAGGGKYLTSDTDSVIATSVARFIKILSPNVHIPVSQDIDGNGHSFSNVYLKYEGDRIVRDIKSALNNLKENDEQEESGPCISPPELTLGHKILKIMLAVADPTAILARDIIVGAYNVGMAIGNALMGNVIESLPEGGDLAIDLPPTDENNSADDTESDDVAPPQEQIPKEQVPKNIKPVPMPVSDENLDEDAPTEEKTKEIADSGEKPRRRSSGGGGGGGSSTSEPEVEVEEPEPVEPEPEPETEDPEEDPVVSNPDPEEPDPAEPDPEEPDPEESDPEEPVPEDPVQLDTFTIDENTTLAPGEYNYENLVITNNAILTLEGDQESTNAFKGVKINAVNLTITEGASISADQKGYGPENLGPGTSSDPTVGASHGDHTGNPLSAVTYGSAIRPIDLGSGGGAWLHRGGGAIQLIVSDTFTNNGTVSASGGNASSGGSIYVSTKKIAGNGTLHANGGALFFTGFFKSPGGGGRIALYYETSSFEGMIEAKGGCGSYDGWTQVCAQDGTVGIFDESENDFYVDSSWQFRNDDGPFSFNNIFISNGAKVISEEGVSVTADKILIKDNSSLALAKDQVLDIAQIIIDEKSTLTLSGEETINAESLELTENSLITIIPEKTLFLEIPNITVDSSSSILADGKGYSLNAGPGAPTANYSGASHGGLGSGNVASSIYGSKTEPTQFGSGGGGYHPFGGGAIRMIVEDTLVNDGIISAIGDNTSSGGSIFITTETLEGVGKFKVDGGGSYCPDVCYGPGGGGRIALYSKTSSFSGQSTANGWSGYGGVSEAGTVYIVDESVVVDPEPELGTAPTITEYTFNGVVGDITTNPLTDPVSINFIADEEVDWVSLKIEKEDDETLYKYFYPGDDCDNKTTCSENWDGNLSGEGTTLQEGIYKIKLHLKNLAGGEFNDYLSPYAITVEIIEDVPEEIMIEEVPEVIPTPTPGVGEETPETPDTPEEIPEEIPPPVPDPLEEVVIPTPTPGVGEV